MICGLPYNIYILPTLIKRVPNSKKGQNPSFEPLAPIATAFYSASELKNATNISFISLSSGYRADMCNTWLICLQGKKPCKFCLASSIGRASAS